MTTPSPAILNMSQDFNTSFKSLADDCSVDVPLGDLNGSVASLSNGSEIADNSWGKRVRYLILFLLFGSCISAIIYLIIRVEWAISLFGQFNLTVPGIGGMYKDWVELNKQGELKGLFQGLFPGLLLVFLPYLLFF